jgi:pyruvate dehydrogenase E1 component
VPTCRAYDPAFACELAIILDHGTREPMTRNQDCFYYLTLMNEPYT